LPVIERRSCTGGDGVNLDASVDGEKMKMVQVKALWMHLDTTREIGLVGLNLVAERHSGHLTSAEVAAETSAARKDDGET